MHPVLVVMVIYYLLVGPQEEQVEPIHIVSIRGIARKYSLNHMRVWRLFNIYHSIHGDDPRYVIRDSDGRRKPTQKFEDFVKKALL